MHLVIMALIDSTSAILLPKALKNALLIKYINLLMTQKTPQFFHHPATAWVILALSLIVTALAWFISDQAVKAKAQERFNFQTTDLASAINKRLLEYETVLRGCVGFFKASSAVSRDEWRQYVNDLRIQQSFPGIQGMGFSLMMPATEVESHIARIRAEGFPDYTVRPPGVRDPTSAIIYLEPFDWRNQRAFGYDMFSEPVRRTAMTQAMDTGEPALSGKITLVQETDQDVQQGFLMYVPLYRKDWPVTTPDERRAAIQGFVYAPFRMRDLMQGILGTGQAGIEFEIYDGAVPSRDTLLFASIADESPEPTPSLRVDHAIALELQALSPLLTSPRFAMTIPLTISQHTWSLFAHAPDSYLSPQEALLPLLVAGAGIMVDLCLFLIIASIARQKQQAESHAHQLTEQLQESMERYQALFTSASAPMLLTDPEGGQIVEANPAALRFYGYDQTDMARLRIADLNTLPPSEIAAEMASAKSAQPDHFFFSHQRANGEIRQVEVYTGPFRYQHKTLLYSIIHDITDRKRQEAELLLNRLRLQNILEGTHVGTWEWNIQTGEVIFNERWAEMIGYQLADLQPTTLETWLTFAHPDDLDGSREQLEAHFSGKSPYYECEVRMQHWAGHWIWVLDRGKVASWTPEGQPLWMYGTHQDVTEHHEQEERLQATKQAAEAASHAKSAFLANMSHEIRTPMNTVIGLTQLLLETKLTPRQHDHLSKILGAATHLLDILNDILDYSKIEAGSLDVESIPLRISDILGTVHALFQYRIEEKQLNFAFHIAPDLPPILYGDPLRLRQVISNLVSNAVKFTEQGSIQVDVACCTPPTDQSVLMKVTVRDTGIGLTPTQRERLFAPFQQADASTTRQYGGTGLGLSISKRLVQLMGGDIRVESEVGTGSVFWFTARLGYSTTTPSINAPQIPGIYPPEISQRPLEAPISQRPLEAPVTASDRVIDAAELLPRIQTLTEMLEAGQSKARQVSAGIETLLAGSALQPAYAPIARSVARLDFETALTQLQALAQQQNWNRP